MSSYPDPGDGYRWLVKGEIIQDRDEYFCVEDDVFAPCVSGIDKPVTLGHFYRRRIDTTPPEPAPVQLPEPEPVQLPEVSKLDEMKDRINHRLSIAEVTWAELLTDLCSTSDVEGCKDLMRNVVRDGMAYLQDSITAWAIRKGWLTETPRNPAEQLMLIVTELAEACEAFRMGNPPCERPGMEQYSHAAEELADVVIRCLQMAGEHNIPLADVVMAKMAFNETRPVKHGKKF